MCDLRGATVVLRLEDVLEETQGKKACRRAASGKGKDGKGGEKC
jgi:hypothetical protein